MLLIFLSVAIAAAPVPLIIDTDLGFNVDDAGALAVAHHLTDIGAAQLLGVVHNTGFYHGIGGCDVINHYYGRNNNKNFIEGAYKGISCSSQDPQNKYIQKIQQNFPSPVTNYDQVNSAMEAYQTMLSSADDNSVVIASIGQLTNLGNILQTSRQLFVQKVHTIYYNFGGGGYNFGCNNSYMDATARSNCYLTAQNVIENIPKSIKQVFISNTLHDGSNLTAAGARFNIEHGHGCGQGPVKKAFQIWTNNVVQEITSWDMVCVYVSVMGDESLYSALTAGTMRMNVSVDFFGNEYFDTSKSARTNNQYRLWIDGRHGDDVTRMLDNALCAAPCLGPDGMVGACSGYQMNAMKNCYDGYGAVNMDNCGGGMSLYDCEQLCDKMDGCTGVTVRVSDSGKVAGHIDCYCRKDIKLGQCDVDMLYDTYTKINVETIKIFVKSTLINTMTLEVDIYEEILNVKNKIKELTGQVHPRQHVLIFEAEELKDFLTLSDYNITAESTLHIAFVGVSSFLPYVIGFVCCIAFIFAWKYMTQAYY